MDNVISLADHNRVPNREEYFSNESPLYFRVWERPVYFSGGEGDMYENPNYKAIVRVDENNTPIQIGMVGRKYKVILMQDICTSIEDDLCSIIEPEHLSNVKIVDNMSYKGGMLLRQYIFPTIREQISDDELGFRIIIVTAYDGSSSFRLYTGAINFFCTNGMVDGQFDMMIRRHTSGLTIPDMAERIKRSIDVFHTRANTFREWVGKTISDEQAEKVFEAIPNVSDNRVRQLMNQYRIEVMRHGRTGWALYNAATYYSSHNEGDFSVRNTGNDNEASTLMHRERQIRSWENTDTFKQIIAA